MPKFPNWSVGTDVSATNLGNDVPNIVVKAAVNSITSNATLANDPELQAIALEIGTWEIEILMQCTATASTGNVKTGWAFSGTLTGTPKRCCYGPALANTAAPSAVASLQLQGLDWNTANGYGIGSNTLPTCIIETCSNFVVATAGNFSFQVAQNASNASATLISVGSRAKVRRIA